MDQTASSQLGLKGYNNDTVDEEVMGTCERGDGLEIAVLSQAKSLEATMILQESRMPAYGRLLCKDMMPAAQPTITPKTDTTAMTPRPRRRNQKKPADAIKQFACESLPVLQWLPALNKTIVKSDLIAGLTVGVMAIPQSMSYASIAGLPYIYGMYSACVPTFIYALFGQSRQLAVGPVAMVSLIVEAGLRGKLEEDECPGWTAGSNLEQYDVCPDAYVNLAILTAACVGVMQIAARFLKMGFLVSFLGHPVVSGFTSGAAIIIGLSQVKYILGFSVAKSEFVYVTLGNIWSGISDGKIEPVTLALGLTWILFLFGNRKISQKVKKLSKLGPLGPLIACAMGILLIWLCVPLREEHHVKYVGDVPSGIFPVTLGTLIGTADHPFSKVISDIPKVLPTAISATLIGYMESIAIGKTLATSHGYNIDAGQELFALGASNLIGSMFGCYPVTGSFSRSAVNNNTGALSQLSGLVTAMTMLCTLLFLTPLFHYLPQFVLAAIVITSVIPLIAVGEARKLWRIRKHDFVLWVVAFLGTLFLGVLIGIGIAVLLSLVIVIYESARPQITVLWRIPGTTIYRNVKQENNGAFIPSVFIARIGSSLYFANASFVKDTLWTYVQSLEEVNKTEYVVLEMTSVVSIDATAMHVIQDIVNDFRSHGIQIAFAQIGNRADRTLRRASATEKIGEQWFFPTVNQAVHYCLQHQRAKKARATLVDSQSSVSGIEVPRTGVSLGDEIGISNDVHHAYTTIYVNLSDDVPMAVSEITSIFQKAGVAVAKAQVNPSVDGGVNHAYFVWSTPPNNDKQVALPGVTMNGVQQAKLTEEQCVQIRSELELFMAANRVFKPNNIAESIVEPAAVDDVSDDAVDAQFVIAV